jgi:hypothetical protein
MTSASTTPNRVKLDQTDRLERRSGLIFVFVMLHLLFFHDGRILRLPEANRYIG